MTRTPALYVLATRTVGTGLRRIWRPRVAGLENVPAGGAILCGNHLSVADELFLAAVVPRHIAFWAKSEYFRGGLTRRIVTGLGAIPVDRGGGRAVLAAFDAALPVLRAGGLIAVFPEGTRSPDGRLYRGRTGAVRLAAQAGVPIVPVGIRGTDRAQPIGARFPRLAPIAITFGPALEVASRAETPEAVRSCTDELITRIQELSGQEYVPSYAPPRSDQSSSVNDETE